MRSSSRSSSSGAPSLQVISDGPETEGAAEGEVDLSRELRAGGLELGIGIELGLRWTMER